MAEHGAEQGPERAMVRERRTGIERAVTRKVRAGQWTAKRREGFLIELAVSANVRASARAVGMSESTAYWLRKANPEFRDAWEAALAEGYAKLEIMMLERAIKGTPKTVATANGKTRRTREFSERLALALLATHRKTVLDVRARQAKPAGAGGPDAVAELMEKFDLMRARLTGEDAGDDMHD